MKIWYSIIFMLLLNLSCYSQDSSDVQEHIESMLANSNEADNQSFYNLLLHYSEHPVNLNKCSITELTSLGLLSKEQLTSFSEYRSDMGPLHSIYELQAIPYFDMKTIKKVLPFVVVKYQKSAGNRLKRVLNSDFNYVMGKFQQILETKEGYLNGGYTGPPGLAQIRLKFTDPGNMSFGLITQKDPGEAYLSEENSLPDFLAGHVYLQNLGPVKQLAFGDYKLQYGQGLILGSGFMTGKNSQVINAVRQNTLGVLPYSSVTEYDFFRGTALTTNLGDNISFALFTSVKNLDASIQDDKPTTYVTTIRRTGLHRTPSELAGRNKQREFMYGAHLGYRGRYFNMGVITANTQYQYPVLPNPTKYNQDYFKGSLLNNFSGYVDINIQNFSVFAEIAKSIQGGWGGVAGTTIGLGTKVDFSFLLRSYASNFYSLYGRSFSEQSRSRNENGAYWGIRLQPFSKLEISMFFDFYKLPWLSSRVLAPSSGKEMLFRVNYNIGKSSQTYFQLKTNTYDDQTSGLQLPEITQTMLWKSILNFDYNLESPLVLRTRVQYNVSSSPQTSTSVLLYQDFILSFRVWELNSRFLLFDAPNILTRQYTYERDMLFSFNTQSFYGKGVRYYAILKVKPTRWLMLKAKWSQSIYQDRSTIGQGYETLLGSTKSQFAFQLKVDF